MEVVWGVGLRGMRGDERGGGRREEGRSERWW